MTIQELKKIVIEDIRIIGLINIEYLFQDKTYNTGDNVKISNFKKALYSKYFQKWSIERNSNRYYLISNFGAALMAGFLWHAFMVWFMNEIKKKWEHNDKEIKIGLNCK